MKDYKSLPKYTIKEFQQNWDELIDRVEKGEHIVIVGDGGNDAVMIPYDDSLLQIYTDHDEAC
jgi:prevent-host-death family protein